jgi:signal transduction histidine kinase
MLQNPIIGWLILGIPVAFVLVAVAAFVVRWSRLRRRPGQDPEAILLGAVSTSLRERGELAATLGELRTLHERILEALPFGLLWIDAKQRIAGLNAEGRKLLKVKQGVIGLEASFVLEPFPWLLESFEQPSGSAWRCPGGGRRWRLRRIEVPDKVGALLEFEDVTDAEAEEQRRQLRERFAELGEMTAGVAHQLKNGLAVLKGHAQLLLRKGHEDTGRELLLETESLEHVVQGFLQWARPLEPHCRELDLGEVAAAALEEVRRRPLAQGRTLVLEGEGRAVADALLLQQALVNLLENACQASPPGGSVKLLVENLRIRVLDQGPGIPADRIVRMLRPFESGRPDGTGLGLPLALKWLNAQGADLRLEARPEGGTCVDLRWPD